MKKKKKRGGLPSEMQGTIGKREQRGQRGKGGGGRIGKRGGPVTSRNIWRRNVQKKGEVKDESFRE